jgi:hypothetical protein
MKKKLENLIGLIHKEPDKEEFLELSRQYNETLQGRRGTESAEAIKAELEKTALDQIMKRLQWHFRAIRHPMPTSEEVEDMIKEYFE